MRRTPPRPSSPDRLHFTTDADGAHHVRRAYGNGPVILDFSKGLPSFLRRKPKPDDCELDIVSAADDVRHERGEWSLTDKGKKTAQKCA